MRLSLTYEGVKTMTVYKIIRIYQLEATSVSQATKKLLDAVEAKKDEEYHVSDTVKESDEATDKNTSWANSLKRQIVGK
jgi:hypothetical protein